MKKVLIQNYQINKNERKKQKKIPILYKRKL